MKIGSLLMLCRWIGVKRGAGALSAVGEAEGYTLFNEAASSSVQMGVQRWRDSICQSCLC